MAQDFNKFFDTYSQTLKQSLSVAVGLNQSFFDIVKIECIKRVYKGKTFPLKILDYGCGAGSITALLVDTFRAAQVDGYDISEKLIRADQAKYASVRNLRFIQNLEKADAYDLVVVTNVLHHIEKSKREEELRSIGSIMAKEGRICIFEHNPSNPLARWIVSRCAFDVGVKLVRPSELRSLAVRAELSVESCRYILHMPFKGKFFRNIDHFLGNIPMGAQYIMIMTRNVHGNKEET